MHNVLKLIIPLIPDTFELIDFNESSGFKQAYLENINKPYLTNHIFVMYDGKLDTVQKLERDERFRKSKYLYSRETVRINNEYVLLYTFVIISETIKRLKMKCLPYKKEEMLTIARFWNFTDSFIDDYLFEKRIKFEVEGLYVPELDYVPDIVLC